MIQRRTRLEEVGWGPGDGWEEEDSTFRVVGLGGDLVSTQLESVLVVVTGLT